MKKGKVQGKEKQYQKKQQYYLIFKMLNPCSMINSNSSTQTTAFSLHYIFLFPLCKQWEGAKGHSPRIAPSVHRSPKEQSRHRRSHLNHIAQGPFLATVPVRTLGTARAATEHWEAFGEAPPKRCEFTCTHRHRNRGAVQRTPTKS